MRVARTAVALLLLVPILGQRLLEAKQPPAPDSNVLLATMEKELHRGQAELAKQDPAPYFTSYNVSDADVLVVVGAQGGVLNSSRIHRRGAAVSMRIGSPDLDNTHEEQRSSGISSGQLPLRDDPDALARVLWKLTYEQYRKAQQAYTNVKTKTAVRAKDEDESPDFTREKPSTYREDPPAVVMPEQKVWEDLARRYSAAFRPFSQVEQSAVVLFGEKQQNYLVSTEGTKVVTSETIFRIVIEAESRADDGMELLRVETFQFSDPARIPSEAEIAKHIQKMASDLQALRTAPLAVPYTGPALLSGRAAAVFFHEVLGHRVEGQRQRGRQEGQTFAKKIGEKILPDFLSVTDDPTLRTLAGPELAGWYRYDDDGVPAARVEIVQDGVL